ncbi:MAG: dUTP diphosphatase [Acidimicrobiaceae bacterium]|nr:dUTP diphosphatase [Acidimicrobiaceae bacterium]
MDLEILRLDPALPIPDYARPGDAGIDLLARTDALVSAAGGRCLIPTGITIALPNGYAGFVLPRSGLALKYGITCLNTPGLIDSGYRGEIKVLLINTDPSQEFKISRGDRIAQLVVLPIEKLHLLDVSALDHSERGSQGFGSTGR